MKDFWCPNCKKKGLHPYNKKNFRPEKTDDITYLWCLHCEYRIESKPKLKKVKEFVKW